MRIYVGDFWDEVCYFSFWFDYWLSVIEELNVGWGDEFL